MQRWVEKPNVHSFYFFNVNYKQQSHDEQSFSQLIQYLEYSYFNRYIINVSYKRKIYPVIYRETHLLDICFYIENITTYISYCKIIKCNVNTTYIQSIPYNYTLNSPFTFILTF